MACTSGVPLNGRSGRAAPGIAHSEALPREHERARIGVTVEVSFGVHVLGHLDNSICDGMKERLAAPA